AAAVAGSAANADALVALIAGHSGHTRALTRQQLGELLDVATQPSPQDAPPPGADRRDSTSQARARRPADPSPLEPLDRLVRSLEEHLDDMARQVKQDVATLALDTARQHIGLALLLAGGLGLMVGLILGALGYPQEVEDGEE
ncbi:MAG: hypothetical protein GXP62_03700, partial [Oligoflexia bacterium]|nr:hypothetical protein [Oligoflexia bacterium]